MEPEKISAEPIVSVPAPEAVPAHTSEVVLSDVPAPRPAPDAPPPSTESTLQGQIHALKELYARVQALRPLPGHLLKTPLAAARPGAPPAPAPQVLQIRASPDEGGAQARRVFREVADVHALLAGAGVQEALKAARESERGDARGLTLDGRRESRKRQRISTPDSPSPYPSFHRRATRAFPPLQDEGRGFVTALGLPVYIREHNTAVGSTTKLHIWAQNSRSGSGARALSNPAVVRVTLRDVVTVFVKMAYGDAERDALVVESVCAFGPREKKGPHSHSDYTVYQKLSEQVARMIEYEPKVSLPQLVDLLASYRGLFMTRCSVCGRVLSQEGHVPPVARVWLDSETEDERGRWDSRHISCLHG